MNSYLFGFDFDFDFANIGMSSSTVRIIIELLSTLQSFLHLERMSFIIE